MNDALRCIVWTGFWLVLTGLSEVGAEAVGWPYVGHKIHELYFFVAGGVFARYVVWPEKFKA